MRISILFLMMMSFLFADIGRIAVAKGEVLIERVGQTILAKAGTKLEEQDKITTAAHSKAQIIFTDETIITIGKNSVFKIDEYLFAENQEPKATFSFAKGAIRSITGKIGKIAPKKFQLKTKTATMGIRGTHFFAVVREAVGELPPSTLFGCTKGAIAVAPVTANNVPIIPVLVPAGQITNVVQNQAPSVPRAFVAGELKEIEQETGLGKESASEETSPLADKKENAKDVIKAVVEANEDGFDLESPKAPINLGQIQNAGVVIAQFQPIVEEFIEEAKEEIVEAVVKTVADTVVKIKDETDDPNIVITGIPVTTYLSASAGTLDITSVIGDGYRSGVISDITAIRTHNLDDATVNIKGDITYELTQINNANQATSVSRSFEVDLSGLDRIESGYTKFITEEKPTFRTQEILFSEDGETQLSFDVKRTLFYDNLGEITFLIDDVFGVGELFYKELNLITIGQPTVKTILPSNTILSYEKMFDISSHKSDDTLKNKFQTYSANENDTRLLVNTRNGNMMQLPLEGDTHEALMLGSLNEGNLAEYNVQTYSAILDSTNSQLLYSFDIKDSGTAQLYGSNAQAVTINNLNSDNHDLSALRRESTAQNINSATARSGTVTLEGFTSGVILTDQTTPAPFNDEIKFGVNRDTGDISGEIDIELTSLTVPFGFKMNIDGKNSNLTSAFIDDNAFGLAMVQDNVNITNFPTVPATEFDVSLTGGRLITKTDLSGDIVSWGYWGVGLNSRTTTINPFGDDIVANAQSAVLPISVWVAGEVTQNLPTNITKEYTGQIIGSVLNHNNQFAAIDFANSSYTTTVDFGAAASYAHTTTMDFTAGNERWVVNSTGNEITALTAISGTGSAVDVTSGTVKQQFYGQDAQAVGGIFKFSGINSEDDTSRTAFGAFKANEN
jgi:hypothetical protein